MALQETSRISCRSGILSIVVALSVAGGASAQRVDSLVATDVDPLGTSGLPPESLTSQQGGWFPTLLDTEPLPNATGDYSGYQRREGDARGWGYSGLWPVRPAEDNFYQENESFFGPFERGLGWFADEGPLWTAGRPDRVSISADLPLPLTRDLMPDAAMFRAGPLFLDIYSISGSVLYTDYNGPDLGPGIDEDGWIGILEVQTRILLRLTDSIYLDAFLSFWYLPESGEVGLSSGVQGFGNLSSAANFNYDFKYGPWDFRVYDYFSVGNNLGQIGYRWNVDALDQVGRYSFGQINESQFRNFWDPEFQGYANTIGIRAERQVGRDWYWLTSLTRSDFWGESDFDSDFHNDAHELRSRLSYLSQDLWIAPYFEYVATATESFESIAHQFYVGATARFTEYLIGDARAGYLTTTGTVSDNLSDSFLWDVSLTHDLTPYTRHGINFGQTYALNSVLDDFFATYARYVIEHQVTSWLGSSLYGQWAEQDDLNGRFDSEFTTWRAGMSLSAAIFAQITMFASADYYVDELVQGERSGWVYRTTMQRALLSRLIGEAGYQYVDQSSDFGDAYDEHLFLLRLTYVF